MSDVLSAFPSLGGGLALLFIVGLATAIASLSIVFVGSAAIVLERLARASSRRLSRFCSGLIVTCVATLIIREISPLALGINEAGVQNQLGFWLTVAVAGFMTFLSMMGVDFLLRHLRADRFESSVFLFVVTGGVFGAGSAGLPAWSGVATLALVGVGFGFAWRRGRGTLQSFEMWIWILALAALLVTGVSLLAENQRVWFGVVGDGFMYAVAAFFGLGLLPLAMSGLADLRGSAEWFIAFRYLIARRRQVFISAITMICIVGIAAGVWLILVVLSVMNGFEETWREEILGHRAHFVVHADGELISDFMAVTDAVSAVPGVTAVSPFLDADAMVRGRLGEIHGLRLRGVEAERIGRVSQLEEDLIFGSLESLETESDSQESGAPVIVIGNRLAMAMGIDLGDDLRVISPFGGAPTPFGPAPRLMNFVVGGIFRSSFQQYDEAYAYVNLEAAQAFRRVGPVIDGIEARTSDHYRSNGVGEAVVSALGPPFQVRDWKEYFPAFFQALKTERIMMFLLLTMIMVVAAFVIVATLMMMIMEKSSDIAILKAMGARDSLIERIFALEGTLIGVAGTVLGVVAALAVTHRISWIQDRIEMITGVDALPETVYQFSSLPSRVDPLQVLIVMGIALVLSLGATLLPSRQGANLDPVEGLRHE